MRALQIAAYTLHHTHKIGVESLEGNYAHNLAAERSHGTKERLYKSYNIASGVMLYHNKIC